MMCFMLGLLWAAVYLVISLSSDSNEQSLGYSEPHTSPSPGFKHILAWNDAYGNKEAVNNVDSTSNSQARLTANAEMIVDWCDRSFGGSLAARCSGRRAVRCGSARSPRTGPLSPQSTSSTPSSSTR